MNETLENIREELITIIEDLNEKITDDRPLGIAKGNWTFPNISRAELASEAQALVDLIELKQVEKLNGDSSLLEDYIERLEYITSNVLPNIWGDPAKGIPAYLLVMNGLRKALEKSLKSNPQEEFLSRIRSLEKSIRGMEARISGLQPRTEKLSDMVTTIQEAYSAADHLPADLELLRESRLQITELKKLSEKDQALIAIIREEATDVRDKLNEHSDDASEVLSKCESAYAAATSVGLAAAFSERSNELNKSTWFWIFGLIAALAIGGYVGYIRLEGLASLLENANYPTSRLVFHAFLSAISIGAPVWFAWLATKQIGQRFRLSEDYAFKASISRAYEGFRREAKQHGSDMEVRVLNSALSRLEELPLRFVENTNHGSPLQELLDHEVIKKALEAVPEFPKRVSEMAADAMEGISTVSTRRPQKEQKPLEALTSE